MLGAKRAQSGRKPGVAQQMLAALRTIGLLGEPVWTSAGAVLFFADTPCPKRAGVPVSLNGVWFNFLRATYS